MQPARDRKDGPSERADDPLLQAAAARGKVVVLLEYRPESADASGINFHNADADTIPLHLAIRPESRRIVFNTYDGKAWGKEAGGRLSRGDRTFLLTIEDGIASVARNDGPPIHFDRRIRSLSDTTLEAYGDVKAQVLDERALGFLDILSENGLRSSLWLATFNPVTYLYLNSDLAGFGLDDADLFRHFLAVGVPEGRQYSDTELFDPEFYTLYYDDIAAETVEDAYRHWLEIGRAEGRYASEPMLADLLKVDFFPRSFDYRRYLALRDEYVRMLPTKWHAFRHWVTIGARDVTTPRSARCLRRPARSGVAARAHGQSQRRSRGA